MSIDIHLDVKRAEPTEADKAIELLRAHGFDQFAAEIEARHEYGDVRVFDENVGGSIVDLAKRIGLPECIWRPGEHDIDKAAQLIEPLAAALATLQAPKAFDQKRHELACVVSRYLTACREHPNATVTVSRDIHSHQSAARREFNGNGGRRSGAAVSAQSARDLGQEKLLLQMYVSDKFGS